MSAWLDVIGPILWVTTGILTWVAAAAPLRGRGVRLGRWATGALFLIAGAAFNLASLIAGVDYGGFADLAHFGWTTSAWQAVVAPNQVLFIGLLVVFEAAVGILAVLGGTRTRIAYWAVIAFYVGLLPFGWFTTAWVLVMMPAMVLLLRAEHREVAAAR